MPAEVGYERKRERIAFVTEDKEERKHSGREKYAREHEASSSLGPRCDLISSPHSFSQLLAGRARKNANLQLRTIAFDHSAVVYRLRAPVRHCYPSKQSHPCWRSWRWEASLLSQTSHEATLCHTDMTKGQASQSKSPSETYPRHYIGFRPSHLPI
ncbi:hypothetical protein GW17_00032937 [Ensete ventricosum]|nr:hypothetical protein GW17_00032937 [Ensete ventricosum]